jgi:hypothetical protein
MSRRDLNEIFPNERIVLAIRRALAAVFRMLNKSSSAAVPIASMPTVGA